MEMTKGVSLLRTAQSLLTGRTIRVYENIKEPPGDGSDFEVSYPWLMES